MKTNWTVTTIEDDDGDVILPFPEDMIKSLGWEEDDELEFDLSEAGAVVLRNISALDREQE